MSLSEFASSLGEASAWDDAIWPRFLECSLVLITEAFAALLDQAQWTDEWHETQFTAALQLCMFGRNEASSPRLPIEIHHERQVLEPPKILSGVKHPNSSPRVEIILRHISMPIRTYLACEAKMLTTKTIGNRTPKASVDFYVRGGMRRFIEGEYAAHVRFGIMIGFVLIGPIAAITARISDTVIRERLPFLLNLTPAASPVCSGHYFSEHPRQGGQIRLEQTVLLVRKTSVLPDSVSLKRTRRRCSG